MKLLNDIFVFILKIIPVALVYHINSVGYVRVSSGDAFCTCKYLLHILCAQINGKSVRAKPYVIVHRTMNHIYAINNIK